MVQAKILTGFSSFLDWKSLEFQKPLPKVMICSLCGVASRSTVLADCEHTFCKECYVYRVLDQGHPRCPFHQKDIDLDNVQTFVFTERDANNNPVRCLNAHNGCGYLGPLCSLEDHYLKDCNFHKVTCISCKLPVLRMEMLDHIANRCPFLEVDAHSSVSHERDTAEDHSTVTAASAIALTNVLKCAVEDNTNLLLESMEQCTKALKLTEGLTSNLMTSVQRGNQVARNTNNMLTTFVEDRARREEVEAMEATIPFFRIDGIFLSNGSWKHIFVFDDVAQRIRATSRSLTFLAKTPFAQVLVNGSAVRMRLDYDASGYLFSVMFEGPYRGQQPPTGMYFYMVNQKQFYDSLILWPEAWDIRQDEWVALSYKRKMRFGNSYLEANDLLLHDKIIFILNVL
ncbi:uncharacterized protein LOC120848625 [Ixodes scapularis]|uniref:RING-type domain-containing protein n=1 Tax=Ixodes scapularis TaxID=6945 RepID=B7Q7Y3_IXOSC|nr:uncharacterized protein LOC120848625 [Ixodes scapularis]EEC14955.1 conserved hypothetical protein [Ixodes scapularis]|eukprot:XP_002412240.1 conserved hypothetical protein [Ixodes scapularis]